MKNIFYILLLLPTIIFAQYPSNSGQKITLGEQTTADGLVFRGVASIDTVTATSKITRANKQDTSAYILLDTVTNLLWHYKIGSNAWTQAGGGDTSLIAYVNTYGTQTVNGAKTFTSAVTGASFIPTSSTIPTNGMYLSATNTLGFSTNSTNKMTLDASGNLMVGTTSAAGKLHVYGSNPFARISNSVTGDGGIKISYGNSDTHGLHLTYNPGSALSYIDNTYPVSSFQIYGDIYFRQNVGGTMTTRMAIKADGGNVGIGTTSPTARLHVKGSGVTSSTTALKVDNSGNTNLLTVLDNGNVGIGTTTDSGYKLDVNGTGRFSGQLTASTTVGGTSAIFQNTGAQNSNGIELRGGTSGTAINWKIEKDNTVGNAFQLTPSTTNGGTTYTTPVLSIASTGAATFSSSVTAAQAFLSSPLGLNVGGYNFYSQTVSGVMGILGHNLRANNSVANQVDVVNSGWYSSMIKMYYSEGITFHTSTTSYNAGDVYPIAATERMRITSGGNVGIGTASPIGKLDVRTSANTSTLYIGTIASSQIADSGPQITFNGYLAGDPSANYTHAMIRGAAASSNINVNGGVLLFYTSDNALALIERMRITSGGDVGIGTISPNIGGVNRALTLNAATSTNASYELSVNNILQGSLYTNISDASVRLANFNSGDLVFLTGAGGIERMRITSGGNVGIGTTTPYTKLQVDGGNISVLSSSTVATDGNADVRRAGFAFKHPNNTVVSALINTTATPDWGLNLHFNVRANNAVMPAIPAMTIQSDGNVGIGTTSPETKLVIGNNVLSPDQTQNSESLIIKSSSNTVGSRKGGVNLVSTDAIAADIGVPLQFNSKLNETNIAYSTASIAGRRENATSNNAAGYLQFATSTSPGSLSEKMRITSGGEVLVGTTILDVNTQGIQLRNNGIGIFVRSGASCLQLNRLTNDGIIASFRTSDVERGSISISGSNTTYNTTSDYRLKYDFKDYSGLDIVSKIKSYDFAWKEDNKRMYGVIAHELQEILEYTVVGEKDGVDMQGVDYSKLTPILVKAVQELSAQIDILKQEIINLKNK